MKDPTRIPGVMRVLQQAWEAQPELSFAELFARLEPLGVARNSSDEELLAALQAELAVHPWAFEPARGGAGDGNGGGDGGTSGGGEDGAVSAGKPAVPPPLNVGPWWSARASPPRGAAEPARPGQSFGVLDATGDVGVRGRAALPPRRATPATQCAGLRAPLGPGAPHHGAGSASSTGR